MRPTRTLHTYILPHTLTQQRSMRCGITCEARRNYVHYKFTQSDNSGKTGTRFIYFCLSRSMNPLSCKYCHIFSSVASRAWSLFICLIAIGVIHSLFMCLIAIGVIHSLFVCLIAIGVIDPLLFYLLDYNRCD